MKHKRISRRELKETIRNERQRHAEEIKNMQAKYDELQKRFEKLGSESIEVIPANGSNGIRRLDIDIKTYGQHVLMYDPDAKDIQYAKSAIARSMAEQLVEQNLIQFTTAKSDFPPYIFEQSTCLTGKIYIVPWEYMNRTKSIAFTIRPDLMWRRQDD